MAAAETAGAAAAKAAAEPAAHGTAEHPPAAIPTMGTANQSQQDQDHDQCHFSRLSFLSGTIGAPRKWITGTGA